MTKVKVRCAEHIQLPQTAHPGDSCRDLRAAITEPVTLFLGRGIAIPTGLFVELPETLNWPKEDDSYVWEFQIRPRSGLAINHGIQVINSPGTIDAGFRGEIKVLLINTYEEPFVINPNDRIAQLALCKSYRFQWDQQQELADSHRGEGGFGHSGVK